MISAPAYTPSPIERLTKGRWKPIWSIRLMSGLAMIPCALSLTVFTTGNAHSFCGGATMGLLIGLLAQSFARQAPSRD
jgi:ABC-type nickel/cobalt efflux system permease component RcnA